MKTAILVDGGFYRRRAQAVFGDKTAQDRAVELENYCKRHLNSHGENNKLILANPIFMNGLCSFSMN